jgi:hypothetical protein
MCRAGGGFLVDSREGLDYETYLEARDSSAARSPSLNGCQLDTVLESAALSTSLS